MRYLLIGWSICLLGSGMAASKTQPKEPDLDPNDFAILPWSWASGDLQTFKDIRECGFNLAGFVSPENLNLARQAGLKAIVSDPLMHANDSTAGFSDEEITSRVKTVVKKVGKNPAAFGYYLRDEPPASMFPTLARWEKAVHAAAPDALAYINLFPNYVGAGAFNALGVKNYDDYLEAFAKTVQPRYVSYDHYAMLINGALRDEYFPNLEQMRAVALRHDIPFWNIVLSNSHFEYAEPSPDTLRFQAYTTLAYGAKGISYFTYFAPNIGNYRLAPVDQFGNKTPTWDALRQVNLQIRKLAPTYNKLKSVNVFHYPDVPAGCRDTTSSKHLKSVAGGHLVVGEFDGPEGQPYAMVVNKDWHHNTTFGISFKKPGTVMVVNAYTGNTEPWAGENVWLAPGQGMLMTVKEK